MKILEKAKKATAIILSLIFVTLIYGVWIEPRWVEVKNISAEIPCLPVQWEGERVGLIADLQIGMWLGNLSAVKESARKLVENRPAFVLIAGDFIYHPLDDDREDAREELASETDEIYREAKDQISKVIELLAPLTLANIPVYAVMGNHDYAMVTPTSMPLPKLAERLTAALTGAGIRVLQNEAIVLQHERDGGKGNLSLVGIGARFPHNDRIDIALRTLNRHSARIVFMHNPLSFKDLPENEAPLALAGHTHGGQIRIPFLPYWSWLELIQGKEIPADGWAKSEFGKRGNALYVNRGLGFSKVPVRINCRPEITMITLKSRECRY